MRLRCKILIVVALAVFYFCLTQWVGAWLAQRVDSRSNPKLYTDSQLQALYKDYNEHYFNNRLPKDVVLDYGESVQMATTSILPDGRFHIAFNEQYVLAERVLRTTMLHEDCHIEVFHTPSHLTAEDVLTAQHGRRWRTCMLDLDLQGAFRHELIDYYEGN